MEPSTDRRARLAQKLSESGLADAQKMSRRERLSRKLQADKEKFNLKKLPQAAGVGTLQLASDAVTGAGVQGQRLADNTQEGVRELTPSPFQREQPELITQASQRGIGAGEPLSRETILGTGKGGSSRVSGPLDKLPEPDETQIIAAAAKLSSSIDQMARDIGYVPSTGFAASVVEGAAQSTPHFVGGIAVSAAGSALAGPGVGLAAGAAYFGASEGLSHTGETYRKLIADGVPQEEAISRASNSGVIYAGASGVLEYAGLGAITKGTRFGKALEKVSVRPKWQQAGIGIMSAGGGEGTTEVLQGVVGEALQGYATDDWEDFQVKYSKSDEPAKEFLSAFLMGGAARGTVEVTNPENYSSLSEWRSANGVESTDATSDTSENQTEGGRQELADAAQNAEHGNPEIIDGSESQAYRNSDTTTSVPQEVIPASEVMIGSDGTVRRATEQEQAASKDQIESDLGRFFSANETTGKVVDAETEQQTKIQADAASRGINVLFVRGEEKLSRAGASPSPGVILIDADLTPGRQTDAITWHETIHEVERRNPDAWVELNADLSELAPELMEQAQERYRAGWKEQTGKDIPPELLAREGPSVAAELIIDGIMAEEASPGTLSRMLRDNPTIKEKIIDLFQAMLRKLGLNAGVAKLEEARRTKEAVNAALLIREAVKQLQPYMPGTATSIVQEQTAVVENTEQNSTDAVGSENVEPETDAESSVVFTRDRAPGEFSKRDIRRKMKALADEIGFDPKESIELSDDEQAGSGTDLLDTSFSGAIPAEITEALEGQPAHVKMQFKPNHNGGAGADVLATLGADEMIRRVRDSFETGEVGIERFMENNRGRADVEMLLFLNERLGRTLQGAQRPIEVQDNPSTLPDGATFEIGGDEFVVYTDGLGVTRMTNGSTDLSLGVDSIPLDKGSLNRDANLEVEDTALEIPFAINTQDKQESFGFTRGNESILPDGRPDLANPGKTEETRRLVNTVDQLRNIAGDPVSVSDAEIESRADKMMKLNSSTIEQSLRDKVDRGQLLDDVETIVAQRLVNQRGLEAVRNKDRKAYKEALITTDSYRRSGTLAARAFRQRRDQLKGPAERYREALMGAFLEPDSYVREKLKDIRDKLMDDNLPARTKKKLLEKQDSIFDRESRRIGKVHEDLQKSGFDPRVLTEEAMMDPTTASQVIDIARRSRGSKIDALYWVWMNSILSGPLTHMANIIGNATNLGWRFAGLKGIEAASGSVHNAFGGDPDFTVGDFVHMWKSLGPSLTAGWTNMAKSWASNRQVFDEQITGEIHEGVTFKGEKVMVPDAGPRSKVLRAAGLNGIPLKLLMAEDQLFKTTAGMMEAHALAHRQAVREGLKGEARNNRIDELLAPRTGMFGEEYYNTDIWNQALEDAKKAVFQDEPSVVGDIALGLRQGRAGAFFKWIIPFIRTPDRLFARGIEASPLGAVRSGLSTAARAAENITGKDASRFQSREKQAGDIATAMSALGLFVAVFAWKDDEDGLPRITGSRSPNWRDLPEQYRTAPALSIRIGDKWYSYARIEPLSTGLALTIDILDRIEQGEDAMEAVSGSGESLIALTKDKTFVRSIGEIMEAFGDPERAGEILTNQARRTFVTAWVPNLFKQSLRAASPEISDNRPASDGGFWTKQAARVPYEALPVSSLAPVPRYDIWGRPIKRGDPFGGGTLGFLWRLGVPINVSDHELHPMDKLIANYNNKVRDGLIDGSFDVSGADGTGEIHARPPQRYFTRNGERIDLTASEYQEMIRNAGSRASERLLSFDLNVDDPSPRDVERIKSVFKREYERERNRIYRERKSSSE